MKTCPRCGRHNTPLHALSRKDNRTMVCDSCGTDEAMLTANGRNVWPDYPSVSTNPWVDATEAEVAEAQRVHEEAGHV